MTDSRLTEIKERSADAYGSLWDDNNEWCELEWRKENVKLCGPPWRVRVLHEADYLWLLQEAERRVDHSIANGKKLRAEIERLESERGRLRAALQAMFDRWERDTAGADRRMWENARAALEGSCPEMTPAELTAALAAIKESK